MHSSCFWVVEVVVRLVLVGWPWVGEGVDDVEVDEDLAGVRGRLNDDIVDKSKSIIISWCDIGTLLVTLCHTTHLTTRFLLIAVPSRNSNGPACISNLVSLCGKE